jgi:8-oxo-dGTP diphosphatase
MERKFNVRVYGILINDQNQLLVSDELIKSIRFTKFPGGGLEWGEGTRDCLVREFMEELSQPVEVLEHFYTTDYFQQSAFRETDQLISIYYKVKLVGAQLFTAKTKPFDFPENAGPQCEVPRWVHLSDLNVEDFKWPVDRLVVGKLVTPPTEN